MDQSTEFLKVTVYFPPYFDEASQEEQPETFVDMDFLHWGVSSILMPDDKYHPQTMCFCKDASGRVGMFYPTTVEFK